SERGIRILCDYLTMMGFLEKTGDIYQLTADSAAFLSQHSQTYLGGTLQFLCTPELLKNFSVLSETIRRGTVAADGNTVSDANPIWVQFARAMVPMMMPAAQAIADLLGVESAGPLRVLDIAAGHGIFGITIAQRNRAAEIVAVDWAPVLAVATENAKAMGVADRHRTIPGDAFKVDYGTCSDERTTRAQSALSLRLWPQIQALLSRQGRCRGGGRADQSRNRGGRAVARSDDSGSSASAKAADAPAVEGGDLSGLRAAHADA